MEKIYNHLELYEAPHYAIAFHIGCDSAGHCGKSFGGIFPEDQRAHISEEIAECGRMFLTEDPDYRIPVPKFSFNKNREDIN